ncbi:NUDIX hydrolase [Thermodesulfovibrio yellowstonii]|uniref:GDP-mannose pyrophosphatase n=1 Tax=Thermodesulfovibrio yellowstonii TaxID=28262 RepID=A0A9W6LKM4_9BACT|nr:NUDIX hydrolase [Thermodesulfovibrio islandicus]GLI53822.1 DNA mismatch repair protein MutT [Thermodesulfovibrio islandicus]
MKILKKEVVWQGKYLRIVLLYYEDSQGNIRQWEAVERVNCNGIVIVIPVTKDKEFVFIRQFRPILGGYVIEFPAGLNDRKESLLEVAKRELIEETGLFSDEIVFLAEGPVSSGLSSEILTVFIAKNVREAPEDVRKSYPPDESENIEVLKIPVNEIFEKLNELRTQGNYLDLKIFGFLELAKSFID